MNRQSRRLLSLFLLPFIGVLACKHQEQRVAGLAASDGASQSRSIVGGLIGGRPTLQVSKTESFIAPVADSKDMAPLDRKIIRTGSLELEVENVPQSLERLRTEAERLGGFIENSTVGSSGSSATLSIRVPADHLDQAIGLFKKLAARVNQESVQAQDVTRQYVDLDARLRNAHAEEAQYLQIMRRAASVKDTLEVAEKLSEVRGRIEQMQGEMRYMTQQIDMSSLQVSLATEAETRVLGVRWRPLRQARTSFYAMLQGLVDWADWAISLIVELPLILLWLATIATLAVVGWRVVRWLWRSASKRTGWKLPSWRLRKTSPDKTN